MGNVKTVKLNVDTTQISENNVDLYSNFGQAPGISNENFLTKAKVGETITWEGISSSAPTTDVVNIIKIKHHGDSNVFKHHELKGKGHPEKVSGEVKKHTNGDSETYTLSFTVFNGQVERGTYKIDPKLAINP